MIDARSYQETKAQKEPEYFQKETIAGEASTHLLQNALHPDSFEDSNGQGWIGTIRRYSKQNNSTQLRNAARGLEILYKKTYSNEEVNRHFLALNAGPIYAPGKKPIENLRVWLLAASGSLRHYADKKP